ncbi:MAG: type I 3-dehydroquinate dehydratase [Candidatus Hydrogenedentes bacterium]|nr:type I 3-dehydroquinate dehydratase [Candidatus Hydrogenedentota bacterium]
MTRLGPITLGGRPVAAIAIQDMVDPAQIRAAGDVVVELRLDALADQSTGALVAFAGNFAEFPLLATIRRREEGGGWKGSEEERLACYTAVLPHVHAVDVEIGAEMIAPQVVSAARALGRLSIGSFHDFAATPSREELESVHARGRALGVDIVKVAARCNCREDLQRLASFTLAHRDEAIITIGMGGHGLVSRIFFPALGSLLTYTFLGDPTAPGQLNCTDTLKYLGDFYPEGCG